MLTSTIDDMVPEKQSVEYFRANRDASSATTPLLHGAKNDIILAAYGAGNTYSFVLETTNLIPTESMGDSVSFVDDDGNMQAYMNIGELRDAAGKSSFLNRIDIAPYDAVSYTHLAVYKRHQITL